MIFTAPWYAILILVLPVCLLLQGFARRRNRMALEQLLGSGMGRVAGERTGRMPGPWLLAGGVVLLVLALMQPQWGRRAEDMPRAGRDIVLLLDTSLSMLAEDVRPNRLAGAKAAIRRLVGAVKEEGGHRLALIAFAGRASLQCPLTLDYDLFLERLEQTGVETIEHEGSLIGDAIQHALARLGGLKPGFADLVLVSDGEDQGSLPIEAAMAAAAAQVALYTLGVGDAEAGSPIPVVDADGERRLLEYDGFEVRSKAQADLLAEMAQLAGGLYLGTGADAAALERLYREVIAAKPRRAIDAEEHDVPAHRYQWFVLLASILLGCHEIWGDRRARTG